MYFAVEKNKKNNKKKTKKTKQKKTGHRLRPFLCLNCFTNTLKYYRQNYRFRKAQN
jgi:hypothetical protein